MPGLEDQTKTNLKREQSRATIITEAVKGLLLVNGGGAFSLLAFLQAICAISLNCGICICDDLSGGQWPVAARLSALVKAR